jgi:hypothetical protein
LIASTMYGLQVEAAFLTGESGWFQHLCLSCM